MLITSVKTRGNFIELFFDNRPSVKIHSELLKNVFYSTGDSISEKDLNYLILISKKRTIKLKAYDLLSRRAHSKKELLIKLLKRKYEKELVEDILYELQKEGYINDKDFALSYAEEKFNIMRFGENKIKSELVKRGVSREIIEETIDKVYDSDTALINAMYVSRKKMRIMTTKTKDKKTETIKLFNFLKNKGYNRDIIRIVIDDLIDAE